MIEVNEKVIFVIAALGAFLIILEILFTLIDLKNDYDCSTTTDINYYNEHNCIKYYKRGE